MVRVWGRTHHLAEARAGPAQPHTRIALLADVHIRVQLPRHQRLAPDVECLESKARTLELPVRVWGLELV